MSFCPLKQIRLKNNENGKKRLIPLENENAKIPFKMKMIRKERSFVTSGFKYIFLTLQVRRLPQYLRSCVCFGSLVWPCTESILQNRFTFCEEL